MTTLHEYLRFNEPRKFRPSVLHGEHMTQVYWEDAGHYCENCGELILCKAINDNRVIGVKYFTQKKLD